MNYKAMTSILTILLSCIVLSSSQTTVSLGTIQVTFPVHIYQIYASQSSKYYFVIVARQSGASFNFQLASHNSVVSSWTFTCSVNGCRVVYPWGIERIDFTNYYELSGSVSPLFTQYTISVGGVTSKRVVSVDQNTRQGIVYNVQTICRRAVFNNPSMNYNFIGFYAPSVIPALTSFSADYTHQFPNPANTIQVSLNQTGEWWIIFEDQRSQQIWYSVNTTSTIQLQCIQDYCGDQIVNNTEQCDDGNTVSGDGCSSTCRRQLPTQIITVSLTKKQILIIGICVGLGMFLIIVTVIIICVIRRSRTLPVQSLQSAPAETTNTAVHCVKIVVQ